MSRSRRPKLPSLSGNICARRRRELALIFALIFGAGAASAPLSARLVPFAAQQEIFSPADAAFSVFAADVDGDGDLDVLSASSNDNTIAWYENTDGNGSFGSQQVISTLADSARSVVAADLDGDGDLDVLSTSHRDDKIAWYENRGGQFALPTTSLAQGVLANSQEDVLFHIDLEHRGRAGDSAVELASLELRLEDGSGNALSSAEANALIGKLEIYLDQGSGSFEPGSDALVEQVSSLALTAGVESIPFAVGDPDAQVAFGASKRYFVVATLTATASAANPNNFQLVHLTEATSTARDASTPAVPLTLEHHADTSTGRIDTDINDPLAVCYAPFELDLQGFVVSSTVLCQAGTALTASGGLQVVSPGDLTLRAGDGVILGVDFSVGTGAKLTVGELTN